MVNINNNIVSDDEEAIFDRILGGGMRYISFAREEPVGSGDYISLPIGTSYTGVTTGPLTQRQATDYGSRAPKFYDDGKPIIDIIATIQTDLRADEEDDGIRGVTFASGLRKALMEEVRRLGIKKFGVGTRMTITLVGFKPNPGGKPSKIFNVDLVPTAWEPPAERATGEVLAAAQPQVAQPATQTQWAQQPAAQPQPQQVQQPVQAAQQPVAPAAPVAPAGPVITAQHVQQVELLINNGIDRGTALQAVSTKNGGDEAFRSALDANVPF